MIVINIKNVFTETFAWCCVCVCVYIYIYICCIYIYTHTHTHTHARTHTHTPPLKSFSKYIFNICNIYNDHVTLNSNKLRFKINKKYIKSYFKYIIFHNIAVLLHFWSNKDQRVIATFARCITIELN